MFLCFRLSDDSKFAKNVVGVLIESGSESQMKLKGKKKHFIDLLFIF